MRAADGLKKKVSVGEDARRRRAGRDAGRDAGASPEYVGGGYFARLRSARSELVLAEGRAVHVREVRPSREPVVRGGGGLLLRGALSPRRATRNERGARDGDRNSNTSTARLRGAERTRSGHPGSRAPRTTLESARWLSRTCTRATTRGVTAPSAPCACSPDGRTRRACDASDAGSSATCTTAAINSSPGTPTSCAQNGTSAKSARLGARRRGGGRQTGIRPDHPSAKRDGEEGWERERGGKGPRRERRAVRAPRRPRFRVARGAYVRRRGKSMWAGATIQLTPPNSSTCTKCTKA